ncbi:MAG: PAS domain S-box protein [Alphaproteobacteria bacterium]|nr:PAS domain S-box protein [Alphaproteobacteria bacterium]
MRRPADKSAAGNEEALFRAIVEGAHDTIIVIGGDGTILEANPAAERYLGFSREELVGNSHRTFMPERFRSQLAPLFTADGSGDPAAVFGTNGVFEGYVRTRDGSEILTEFSCEKIPLDGSFAYVFIDRDIRERRASERALQNAHDELETRVAERTAELGESEARLRAVLDSAPSTIFLKDTDGRYLLVNRKFEERLKIDAEDILGRRSEDLDRLPADLIKAYLAQEREVLESGRTITREQEWQLANGQSGVNLTTKFPIFNADREIVALGTINLDITDQKRAFEMARENAHRLRMIADSLPAIVVHIGADLCFTFVNRFYCEWHGMVPDEVLGRHVEDVIGTESFEIIRPNMETALDGQPVTFEADLVYKGVGRKFVRIHYIPDVGEDGRVSGFYSLALDISEQKAAEAALRASEARLSRILTIAPDAIISIDHNQTIHMFNQGAEAVFGFTAEEALGQSLDILIPPRSHEIHARHIANFISDDEDSRLMTQRSEIVGRRKDGSEFPAEASISKLYLGSEIVLTVMLHDITERKQAEAELLAAKETAEYADRAKSDFLANMSHELRTPLNAILGFAQMIRDLTFGDRALERYISYARDIHDSGEHLLNIINDILDLSKIEAGKAELDEQWHAIGELVEDSLRLVEVRAQKAGLELHFVNHVKDRRLLADGRMIRQMLLNLLTNAVKFTRAGGRVTVTASYGADGGLELTVADSGIGIDKQDLDKALSQFGQVDSALNRRFQGTGLGLPLVSSLAELHGGRLELQSEPSVGTTATIWLPAERLQV